MIFVFLCVLFGLYWWWCVSLSVVQLSQSFHLFSLCPCVPFVSVCVFFCVCVLKASNIPCPSVCVIVVDFFVFCVCFVVYFCVLFFDGVLLILSNRDVCVM